MLETAQPPTTESVVTAWWRRAANFGQMAKYAIVGLGAVAVDLAVFLLLTNRGIAPLAANAFSVATAVAFSFVLNARYTFGVRDRVAKRFGAFAIVNLIGFTIGQALLLVAIEGLGLTSSIAKLASIPVVVGAQYVLNSNWTFLADE